MLRLTKAICLDGLKYSIMKRRGKNDVSKKKPPILTALLFGFTLFFSGVTQAQAPAATPCDPDYYKSLKAKAWLEAQREITQNQNLIFKPDSVLEYTCFERQLNALSQNAGSMFSENPKWGGAAAGMAGTLTGLVGTPMFSYLQANFRTSTSGTYGLLGGRIDGNDPAMTAVDATMTQPTITAGDYSCDIMNKIWQAAKCMNFSADISHDGFYTLEHYVNNDDKRFLPARCLKPTGLNSWDTNYDDAIVDPPWTRDPVNSFSDKLLYDGNPASCDGVTPIPTGIEIYVQGGITVPEKICVMPGCYYVPGTGNDTGKCVGVID